MITIYTKSGRAVEFAHMIDAKESVANGSYVWEDPTKKPELPAKSEAKPAVLPTVEDKKPVVEEPIIAAEPVMEEEPVFKEDPKPIAKPKRGRPSKIIK